MITWPARSMFDHCRSRICPQHQPVRYAKRTTSQSGSGNAAISAPILACSKKRRRAFCARDLTEWVRFLNELCLLLRRHFLDEQPDPAAFDELGLAVRLKRSPPFLAGLPISHPSL